MKNNVIALGAGNKTSFSVIDGNLLYVSDSVKDLSEAGNLRSFEDSLRGFLSEKGLRPAVIACDEHPDYVTTALAEKVRKEVPEAELIRVQHHHAHIAACMLDNGLDEAVIGVSFDGTGLGDDGRSWGGEFMVCTRGDYKRCQHLKYVPVPGGDIAAREIWRMGLSYLVDVFGQGHDGLDIPFLKTIDPGKLDFVKRMIEKDVNCPYTSSMGRLFDAVAAITGVCCNASFEAEGAILLERAAVKDVTDGYEYEVTGEEIKLHDMVRGIVRDMSDDISPGVISARFHNTVIDIVFKVSGMIAERTGLDKVLLSGGCFLNGYITDGLEKRFSGSGMRLYRHIGSPTSDLGVSTGQAVVAYKIYGGSDVLERAGKNR